MNATHLHYTLRCLRCGEEYEDSDEGFLLACQAEHEPALLRARYANPRFDVKHEVPGLFRFAEWLPVRTRFENADGPIVFHSTALGTRLGLDNLYCVFSGYWPERGAFLETGTFKELEASPVCARIPKGERRKLVVSSAGNTARAFLHVCSQQNIPCVVVVPEGGLPLIRMTRPKADCVKLVALKGHVDYFDAIRFGQRLSSCEGYFPEGGAKNVARRDGMGTVLLSFVEKLGVLPEHYVQAVGSGTGGIANWEMSLRLREDGRFGTGIMRLHLCQNAPFTPMTDAWNSHSATLLSMTEEEQRQRIQKTRTRVLSNRQPPYSVTGGVYDALRDTGGCMYAVGNTEAERAGSMFCEEEGCDLMPAAEVALAGLIQAVRLRRIQKHDLILLNLTGGGAAKIEQEKHPVTVEPDMAFNAAELEKDDVLERMQTLW